METKSIEQVKDFWENNPLFSGESKFSPGTKEFFEDHKQVYYDDVFAGNFPEELVIPNLKEGDKALDLGCGVGFWVIEIKSRNVESEMYGADLTQNALDITKKRLDIYNLTADLSLQNAENLNFDNDFFNHVNCQGVIHHTPNTQKAMDEIARVLKSGGSAYMSVYYKNFFVRSWKYIYPIGKLLTKLGAGFKGRGRESIFAEKDTDSITRLYDGSDNPIGKAYSKQEVREMVDKYFVIDKMFLNFFPARTLPFPVPKFLHSFLSKYFGFMIHYNLTKK